MTEQVNNNETGSQTPAWSYESYDYDYSQSLSSKIENAMKNVLRKTKVADAFWAGWKECPDCLREKLASSTRSFLYEHRRIDKWDLEKLVDKIVQDAHQKIPPRDLSMYQMMYPMIDIAQYTMTHDLLLKLSEM